MTYVQRALSKKKPATKIIGIEQKEKAKGTIYKLLLHKQFAEEIKSLKSEKEIPRNSKILQFSPFFDKMGLIRAKGRKVNR